MPNKYQLAFLGSFAVTFSLLVLISRFINKKLLAAGYDISNIILIGLPPDPEFDSHLVDRLPLSQVLIMAFQDASSDFSLPVVGAINLTSGVILAAALVILTFISTKFMKRSRKPVLNPDLWQEFPLVQKNQVNKNTALYRFSLPDPQDILGLPTGQHISISAEINGKMVTRSYTPVSNDDQRGYFELLIKTYEQGNISRYVSLLKIGDKIRVKGPKGQFHYAVGLTGHLSMLAGGSGITPMLQIVRSILKDPFDKTSISLIYANINHEDILLKHELDDLVAQHGARFRVFYVLNNPPPGWTGGSGFVTKEHIAEYLPNPATTNSKLLLCGPPPMMTAMKKHIDELGYPTPRTISKLVDKVFVF